TARFAPEVIDGYMTALDLAKRKSKAQRLTLVGYSGGGAVAALLAARRKDVTLLVTVAGTLDQVTWTREAGVTPLSRSLNPRDFAPQLRTIPQVHFVGGRDTVVPLAVTQSYLMGLGSGAPVKLVSMPEYDHECCWVRDWQALLGQYVQNAATAR